MSYTRKIYSLSSFLFLMLALFSCKKPIDFSFTERNQTIYLPPTALPDTLDKSIYTYYDFNTSIGGWYEISQRCSWSGTIQKVIKRAGTGALKVELRKADIPNGHRSELGMEPSNKNADGWYAFALHFPPEYISDSMEESIVQWHAQPDMPGEVNGSAPVFLGVVDNKYILELRTDPKKTTIQGDWTYKRIDLGPIDIGKWADWVFHIKWAYDNTGILEIWKNKVKVISRINLPNSFNDATYPYFKIGIYRYGWSTMPENPIKVRTVYVDEVKIGDGTANLEKMSSVIN